MEDYATALVLEPLAREAHRGKVETDSSLLCGKAQAQRAIELMEAAQQTVAGHQLLVVHPEKKQHAARHELGGRSR